MSQLSQDVTAVTAYLLLSQDVTAMSQDVTAMSQLYLLLSQKQIINKQQENQEVKEARGNLGHAWHDSGYARARIINIYRSYIYYYNYKISYNNICSLYIAFF